MTATAQGFLRPTTTPTPDEIFDVWLTRLSGAELKVLLYIVRRTLGFKKDADTISLAQICHGITTREGRMLDAGTGLSKTAAYKAVQKLEALGLITVRRSQTKGGGNAVNVYSLRFRGLDGHGGEPQEEGEGGGLERYPGVDKKDTQGGLEKHPGVGEKDTPQQTGLQETVGQQTGNQPPAPPDPGDQGVQPAGAAGAPTLQIIPDSPTHGISPPLPTSEDEEAARLLVEFGVWRSRARQAARRYNLTPQLVRRARDALAREIAGGARFANPSAILLSRLEAGWEPPEIEEDEALPVEGFEDGFGVPEGEPLHSQAERKPLLAIVDTQGQERDAYAWFEELKEELKRQMPQATFDTWLRTAELADYRPPDGDAAGVITIRLQNLHAQEWIRQRLHKVVQRVANHLASSRIAIEYTGPQRDTEDRDSSEPRQVA